MDARNLIPTGVTDGLGWDRFEVEMINDEIRELFFRDHGFRVSEIPSMLDGQKMAKGFPDKSLDISGRGNISLDGCDERTIEDIDNENTKLLMQLNDHI